VVKVTYQPTDFSVLVRAYGKGSELIIDRKQEIIVSSIYIYIYKTFLSLSLNILFFFYRTSLHFHPKTYAHLFTPDLEMD
jgi:hypothetical protein